MLFNIHFILKYLLFGSFSYLLVACQTPHLVLVPGIFLALAKISEAGKWLLSTSTQLHNSPVGGTEKSAGKCSETVAVHILIFFFQQLK